MHNQAATVHVSGEDIESLLFPQQLGSDAEPVFFGMRAILCRRGTRGSPCLLLRYWFRILGLQERRGKQGGTEEQAGEEHEMMAAHEAPRFRAGGIGEVARPFRAKYTSIGRRTEKEGIQRNEGDEGKNDPRGRSGMRENPIKEELSW